MLLKIYIYIGFFRFELLVNNFYFIFGFFMFVEEEILMIM